MVLNKNLMIWQSKTDKENTIQKTWVAYFF